jgi:hypothetical protein
MTVCCSILYVSSVRAGSVSMKSIMPDLCSSSSTYRAFVTAVVAVMAAVLAVVMMDIIATTSLRIFFCTLDED